MIGKEFLVYLLVIISGYLTYSKFNIIGSNANPIFFLIFGILFLLNENLVHKFLKNIKKVILIFLISSVISFFFIRDIYFDLRFILTAVIVFLEFTIVVTIGDYIATLTPVKLKQFIIYSCLIFSISVPLFYFLNIINFDCYFLRCFPSYMTFASSEPSYVGSFAFFGISFSFIKRLFFKSNNKIFNYEVLTFFMSLSCIYLVSSNLLIALTVIYGVFCFVFTYAKDFLNIFFKFKLKKNILFLLIVGILFGLIFVTQSSFFNELLFIFSLDLNNIKFNWFAQNSLHALFLVSGNRLGYFFSNFVSNIPQLFFGHGVFSSSNIFEDNINKLFSNLQFGSGYILQTGAKPVTTFGMFVFVLGLVGTSIIIYLFFIKRILYIKKNLNFLNNIENKFIFNWVLFSPLLFLFYPIANTDAFKFLGLLPFIILSERLKMAIENKKLNINE